MQKKYSFTLLAGLLFYLATFSQAPANDDCSGAINVPVNTNTTCYTFITGTTVNATQSMPGCDGDADDDVWYKFTTISAGIHYITITPAAANGITGITLEVFLGDCSSLSSIVCGNTTGGSLEISTGGSEGATYYFRVYSYSTLAADRGSFEVCIKQEINLLNFNILNNPGFEFPVQSTIGDHVLAAIPEWSTGGGLQPNIIRADGTGYAGGPDTAHAGNQYIELTGGDGYLTQHFTLTGPSSIFFGGWFSRREASTNGFDSYIEIVDANTNLPVTMSSTVSFTCCENQELWKNVNGTVTLPGGNYIFRVQLNDYANFDSAFVTPFDPYPPSVSITASQTLICANTNVTFTATPVNIGTNPSYKWQKNGVDIIDSNNPVYNDNTLTGSDVITCKLTSENANGIVSTVTSNSLSVSINPVCYCIPPFSSNQSELFITTVSINGTGYTNPANPLYGYTDFTASVFNGRQAFLSSFSVTVNNTFTYVRIWIDYNNNLSFDDPGELVFAQKRNGLLIINGSFFIPTNASVGSFRLRVRSNAEPVYGPCDQGSGGETEDYTINIAPGNSCNGTSASFAFASQYVVCYGDSTVVTAYANDFDISYQWQSASTNSGFANITGATGNTYSATGITDSTYYRCMFTCAGNEQPSSVLAITIGAVPANDNICDAITLTTDVFDYQNTTCATVINENFPESDVCSTPNNTVWYKITPAVTERLRLKMNKVPNDPYPIDAWVNIFKATGSCPNLVLTPVSPNPFNCLRANLPNDSSVTVESGTYEGSWDGSMLDADTTYYIRIDGFIGSFGAFGITSLTPAIITNTWTGTVSDEWENVNNWSNHSLPNANTEVIINGNMINYPKLNSHVTIRSLKANAGASLIILSDTRLTLSH